MSPAKPVLQPEALSALYRSARIWRGGEFARPAAVATGFAALDSRLPGGGWPIGALTEIVPVCLGIGELSITLPAIQTVCAVDRSVCFIQTPYTPYAPALVRSGLPLEQVLWIRANDDRDARWAAEELLRESKTGAVLLWSSTHDDRALRRLQLAAESGRSLAFLYRTAEALRHTSPAALRLALRPQGDEVEVSIVKVRGGHAGSAMITVPWVLT